MTRDEDEDDFNIAPGKVRSRWGSIADAGYQPVMNALVHGQKELGLKSEELNVLLNITAHYQKEDGRVFVRSSTIARRMGVSVRTIQRSLGELKKLGLLRRVRSTDRRASPEYDLDPLKQKLAPIAKRLVRLRRKVEPPSGVRRMPLLSLTDRL